MTSSPEKTSSEHTVAGPAIVALDVGGANIKLVSSDQRIHAEAFPLWRQPERLAEVLTEMLQFTTPDTKVVATMTGELADCFDSKRQGVEHIVDALETAVGGRSLRIYLTSGEFVSPTTAKERYQQAAASNWHALASYVARQPTWQNCLLVDAGSTTCDVIPIVDGQVVTRGVTDTQRLLAGELVYVGAERTPVSMVAPQLPYRGYGCPVAREVFATMTDVGLVLGFTTDREENLDTADGRPACREYAVTRLGRCVCADEDEWTDRDATLAARYVQDCTTALIRQAIQQVYQAHPGLRNSPVVVSGHGDWLLEPLLETTWQGLPRRSLQMSIGAEAARAAPAYALAILAEDDR